MASDELARILAEGPDLFVCGNAYETEVDMPPAPTPCHADCATCYGDSVDACCFCDCVTPNNPMP
jgi:hypothetical protein